MHPEFFFRIAQRCRELMARTDSEFAKEQLQMWADEFDAHAEIAHREPQQARPSDQP